MSQLSAGQVVDVVWPDDGVGGGAAALVLPGQVRHVHTAPGVGGGDTVRICPALQRPPSSASVGRPRQQGNESEGEERSGEKRSGEERSGEVHG